jgi:hypothetical protein
MPDDSPVSTRRSLLKGALAAAFVPEPTRRTAPPRAVPQAGGTERAASAPAGRANAVAVENEHPGSPDWQLTRVGLDRLGGKRSPRIEGYASKQSVEAGETLEFKVSVDPAARFRIEIFRLGYYGGLGARLLRTLGPFEGGPQPIPGVGMNRVRECRWRTSAELTVPREWASGVYLARLSTLSAPDQRAYWQSYVIFIVRDRRRADVLFQCSDNTWQAYNQWPDAYSLYTDPRAAHAPGVSVSFDRPYGKFPLLVEAPQSVGSGEFLLWEYPLCYWLERSGYDVTYCSNSDIVTESAVTRAKVFLSVGHDEYWDVRQFESLKQGVGKGLSILFLSANTAYMMSPFSPASDGRPNRIITRTGPFGALSSEEKEIYGKVLGPFDSVGPDEAQLIGARTTVPFNGCGDWICARPDHWIFARTGMRKGDRVPGLVGWEYHGEPADIPGLEVVGEGAVVSEPEFAPAAVKALGTRVGRWTATIYPGPRGNFVFNAATIWWAQGLASPPGHVLPWAHWTRPQGADERVQQITHNLLRRAIAQ